MTCVAYAAHARPCGGGQIGVLFGMCGKCGALAQRTWTAEDEEKAKEEVEEKRREEEEKRAKEEEEKRRKREEVLKKREEEKALEKERIRKELEEKRKREEETAADPKPKDRNVQKARAQSWDLKTARQHVAFIEHLRIPAAGTQRGSQSEREANRTANRCDNLQQPLSAPTCSLPWPREGIHRE